MHSKCGFHEIPVACNWIKDAKEVWNERMYATFLSRNKPIDIYRKTVPYSRILVLHFLLSSCISSSNNSLKIVDAFEILYGFLKNSPYLLDIYLMVYLIIFDNYFYLNISALSNANSTFLSIHRINQKSLQTLFSLGRCLKVADIALMLVL